MTEAFNDYFVNVVSNLGIYILGDNSVKGDISNYDNQPSIITIKQRITDTNKVFSCIILNRKKATLSNDILTKIIQQFSEIFTDFLYNTSIVA